MTEEQAAKIIALLESIDSRLKSVIEGDCTLDVTVKGFHDSVEVYGSVATYEKNWD